eukprot:sb/3476279/
MACVTLRNMTLCLLRLSNLADLGNISSEISGRIKIDIGRAQLCTDCPCPKSCPCGQDFDQVTQTDQTWSFAQQNIQVLSFRKISSRSPKNLGVIFRFDAKQRSDSHLNFGRHATFARA